MMRTMFKRVLAFLGGRWRRGYSGRTGPLNRSRLVGMYLAQTNGREANSTQFQSVRERRNGRLSQGQGRERG